MDKTIAVRVDPAIHRLITIHRKESNISLQTYITSLVANDLKQSYPQLFNIPDNMSVNETQAQGFILSLPCAVGTTVFVATKDKIIESKVTGYIIGEKGVEKVQLFSVDDRRAEYNYNVFLNSMGYTRDEAESKQKCV
jgi:hypothetical protein